MASWGRALLVAGMLAAAAGAGLALARPGARRSASAARWIAVASLLGATSLLGRALLDGDWSWAYVAGQARRGTDGWYRLAGLWGGMEGSLLLWTTLAAGVAAATGTRRRHTGRWRTTADGLAGAGVASLAAVTLAVADPFGTLDLPPIDGAGLDPILEHPAMLVHPPVLYLGLVAGSAAWAAAVAAAWLRPPVTEWRDTLRRRLLVAWTLTLAGMALGANWAYVELGWGGYWAWDPVENTALMPWLAATAALHALARLHRGTPGGGDGGGRRLALGLGALPWVLALLGTLLTRSGATPSVHAFAEDPAAGRALGTVVAAAAGLLVAALVRRWGPTPPSLSEDDIEDAADDGSSVEAPRPATRAVLLWGVGAVAAALGVVLLGTVQPAVAEARTGVGATIDGTWFARFVTPLAVAALVLGAWAPWAGSPQRLRRAAPQVAGAAAAGVVLAMLGGVAAPLALAGAAIGAGSAAAAIVAARAGRLPAPAALAHLGVALAVAAVTVTTTSERATVALGPGEVARVGGFTFEHVGTEARAGEPGAGGAAGRDRVVSTIVVREADGDGGHLLEPMLVAHTERRRLLAETALWSRPWVDVQVALRTATDGGAARLDLAVQPGVTLVWWSAVVLVVAGGWALVRRSATRRPEAAPAAATPDR